MNSFKTGLNSRDLSENSESLGEKKLGNILDYKKWGTKQWAIFASVCAASIITFIVWVNSITSGKHVGDDAVIDDGDGTTNPMIDIFNTAPDFSRYTSKG